MHRTAHEYTQYANRSFWSFVSAWRFS